MTHTGYETSTLNPKFMSPQGANGRMRKQRPGVCHRCGWAGPVSRLGRADRRPMTTGKEFGRLCPDCVDYLVAQSAGLHVHAQVPLRSRLLHRRDVA